mmetsp:Transcript_22138/g.37060  ORF Transcript_22138/g.37060 Transcript_22138/m.37060 type:complete len:502 (-) Transcript_22138:291-1796(-)
MSSGDNMPEVVPPSSGSHALPPREPDDGGIKHDDDNDTLSIDKSESSVDGMRSGVKLPVAATGINAQTLQPDVVANLDILMQDFLQFYVDNKYPLHDEDVEDEVPAGKVHVPVPSSSGSSGRGSAINVSTGSRSSYLMQQSVGDDETNDTDSGGDGEDVNDDNDDVAGEGEEEDDDNASASLFYSRTNHTTKLSVGSKSLESNSGTGAAPSRSVPANQQEPTTTTTGTSSSRGSSTSAGPGQVSAVLGVNQISNEALVSLASSCCNLRVLDITVPVPTRIRKPISIAAGFAKLVQDCTQLVILKVKGLNQQQAMDLIPHCANIESLWFPRGKLKEPAFAAIGHFCRRLKNLDLSDCMSGGKIYLSHACVVSILTNNPKLKRLWIPEYSIPLQTDKQLKQQGVNVAAWLHNPEASVQSSSSGSSGSGSESTAAAVVIAAAPDNATTTTTTGTEVSSSSSSSSSSTHSSSSSDGSSKNDSNGDNNNLNSNNNNNNNNNKTTAS